MILSPPEFSMSSHSPLEQGVIIFYVIRLFHLIRYLILFRCCCDFDSYGVPAFKISRPHTLILFTSRIWWYYHIFSKRVIEVSLAQKTYRWLPKHSYARISTIVLLSSLLLICQYAAPHFTMLLAFFSSFWVEMFIRQNLSAGQAHIASTKMACSQSRRSSLEDDFIFILLLFNIEREHFDWG